VLRSLLSEPEVRRALRQHFVCTWVLKDDLARDQQSARAVGHGADADDARSASGDSGRRGSAVEAGVEDVKGRLAAALLGAAPELAQIIVLSPPLFQASLMPSSLPSLHADAGAGRKALSPGAPASAGAAAAGEAERDTPAEAAEGGGEFLSIYTETGRNAAFDRTLFGFLAFLHASRDGGAAAGGDEIVDPRTHA